MEKAMSQSKEMGAMAALMPITAEIAQAIVQQVSAEHTFLVCAIANYNSSKQIVISGHEKAISRAMEIAKEKYNIRRCIRLNVNIPFHCALMQPAALELEEYLQDIEFQKPTAPIISNVTATPVTDIKAQLVQQVVQPVHWYQSIDYCIQQGSSCDFIEFGYGNVLTGLLKQHNKSVSCTSIGDPNNLLAFIDNNHF